MPNINSDEVTISLRVSKELRDAFDNVTSNNDETKSQVLRNAIREYLRQYAQGKML